ncbi:MAG: carboxypeptidase-like regulatory domain-containing protein [Cyclobacteriaceae bacterium]|nr:carboxypeptidase-like regulatory domain-containing protein [Cyclobacteriaceae bacterium]
MKIVENLFFIFILGFFFSSRLSAQEFSIIDKISGEAIQYAHILFVKSEYGTYSDLEGKFSIPIDISTDSVVITHINYKDTIIASKQMNKIITLNPRDTFLNEVKIIAKAPSKPLLKRKSSWCYLNIPSFEIGLPIQNNSDKDQYLSAISIPIKGGIDSAIIAMNVYCYSSEEISSISEMLRSKSFVVAKGKQNIELVLDQPILIPPKKALFFSFELMGYLTEATPNFKEYDHHKQAIAFQTTREHTDVRIRIKNKSHLWVSATAWGEAFTQYSPNINLTFE